MDCWTIVSAITSALSALFALLALIFAFSTYRKNVKQERIRATLTAFPLLRSENPELILEIGQLSEKDRVLTLKDYLRKMEHFAVGVNSEAYDVDIVNKMSGGMLINQYEKHLKDFIISRQTKKNTTDTVPPQNAYCEYIKMIKILAKKRNYKLDG